MSLPPTSSTTTESDRARRVADLVEAMGWDAERVSSNHPVFFVEAGFPQDQATGRESDDPSDPLVH